MEPSRSGPLRNKLAAAAIVITALIPATIYATSIQVSPSRLEFNLDDKPVSQTLVVANPSDEVLYFQVSVDSFQDDIDIYPKSFTLEAGVSKKVQVTVKPNYILGVGTTDLSVISQPISNSQLQIHTGAKIPITITHAAFGKIYPAYFCPGVAILIILLVILLYFRFGRQKSK